MALSGLEFDGSSEGIGWKRNGYSTLGVSLGTAKPRTQRGAAR